MTLKPKQIVELWHQAAYDYDLLSTIAEVNEVFKTQLWDEDAFQNILTGFRKREDEHREFLDCCGYDWVTNRDAYDSATETTYQYHAMGVISGVWWDSSPEMRRADCFRNICVRLTKRWGSLQDISPRAIPASAGLPIKLILIPSGWPNFSSWVIEAFADACPWAFQCSMSELSQKPVEDKPYPIVGQETLDQWVSLAIACLVSNLDCPESLVSGAQFMLAEKITQFVTARKYVKNHGVLNRRLSCCQATDLFAIAHEVGHHLMDAASPSWDGDEEKKADLLAYRGLWNYPTSIAAVTTRSDEHEELTILAGGLFSSVVHLGIAADQVVRAVVAPHGAEDPRVADTSRMDAWQLASEQIVNQYPELNDSWIGIQQFLLAFECYKKQFLDYLSTIIPEVIDQTREALAEYVASNPGARDREKLAELARNPPKDFDVREL